MASAAGSAASAASAASATPETEVLVRDLTVCFRTDRGEELPAVAHADLTLQAGLITGLVGESGSGKSTLALTLLGAVPSPGRITSGSVQLTGIGDVTRLKGAALRQVRGGKVGYVFQASQNSLNPLKTVGKQLLDLGRAHDVEYLPGLVRRARELCELMGMDGKRVLDSYQHELSGGMRQRVGIVFALVLNARVLVLDEPTTALDMLSQAAVLKIIGQVHKEIGLTTLIVTHDMGVVSELADRLAVMYGGRIVEDGPAEQLLRRPSHPYTRALINATARVTGDISRARALPGRPPDLASIPRQGCVFRQRCAFVMDQCATEEPPLDAWGGDIDNAGGSGRRRACHATPEAVIGA
ncbi:ABC transporter ATP-binding protein [Actinospica durhamensis]|uniref:ABC transporter ATP-binding protein n=1 Tax=Actinospica durhamensis TaxID=1508375 RepID=A0A941EPN8_9ACTN|nr:ABC transporter ATP-binding protein [Actinospica durhamensis]